MLRSILSSLVLITSVSPAATVAQEPHLTRDDAHAAYVSGDSDRAEEILHVLLKSNPEDADLLRRLAAVQAAFGKLDEAQQTIDHAYKLSPNDTDIQLGRAHILLWRGERDAARQQANIVRSRDPQYPGLAQFDRSFDRSLSERDLHLRSVHASFSTAQVDFDYGNSQTWRSQNAAVALSWDAGTVGTLQFNREERGTTDTRLAARVDFPAEGIRFFLAGSAVPNADFREKWSLSAGGEIALGRNQTLLTDARFAAYQSNDVGAFGLGLRHTFSDTVSLSMRSIHLYGGGDDYRIGAVSRLDFTSPTGLAAFALVGSYPDVEEDGTRQLRSIAAGVTIPVDRRITLRVTGEYEDRKQSYERTAAIVGIGWKFNQ